MNFGRYFSEKMRSTPKKYRPNGEISPNLATLDEVHKCSEKLFGEYRFSN
jgi:hypothetical protein